MADFVHAAAMPLLKLSCQDSLLSRHHPVAPIVHSNNFSLEGRQQQQQKLPAYVAHRQSMDKRWSGCRVLSDGLAFVAHHQSVDNSWSGCRVSSDGLAFVAHHQSVDKPWSRCRVSSDRLPFVAHHQSVDKSWSGCRVSSDGPCNGLSDVGKRISVLQSFRITGQKPHFWRHVCMASGQGSAGKAAPDEDDPKAVPEQTPPTDGTTDLQFQIGGGPMEMDWRAFRAQLVQSERPGNKRIGAEGSMMPAAKRWAHPILAPEAGCVLIATEKLDGQQNFERTVILLLSPGSSNPREGPYGLILNRPLLRRIKDIKPKDRALVKHFGNCQAHLGGPMDTEVFLQLHGTSGIQGYQEVIPGVYCGTSKCLEPVAEFAKRGNHSLPQGFRFFFGYSGWGSDQLKKEIAAGLWCVAACSSDLITSASTSGLWEGVLQLMGGKYLELSKRPRRKQY